MARDGRLGGVAINFADRRAWFWVWLFLDSFSFLTATPSSSAHRGTLKPFHVVKKNVCWLIFSFSDRYGYCELCFKNPSEIKSKVK